MRSLVWPAIFVSLAAIVFSARIRREMVDFGVYRTAAIRASAAEPLYRVEDGHYQFKYLPAFAIVMAPMGHVDPEAAKAVWFALSVGLLTALVRWSVRALPERRLAERVLLVLTVVFMAKFYLHELTLGQTNILLGVLLVGGLLAVQIDQPVAGGVLIGLAAFVKPYALLLLPWLAITHGMAAATAAVGVLLAGLILPVIRYGWSGNLALLNAWFRTVTGSTAPNLVGADNISLAAMWAKWIGVGRTAATLATLSSLALLALSAAVWWRRRRVDAPDYLEFSLLMLLIPLVSPQGWDYVLLLATPAIVVLVDRWRELTMPWRLLSGAAIALMCLTIFDVMGRTLYARFMMLSIVTVAAVAIVATLAHLRWRALA
jgi:Glycosyltransferase family 87